MKSVDSSPLLRVLAQPETLGALDAEALSLLVAEARTAGILGRIAALAETAPVSHDLAQAFRAAMSSAQRYCQGFETDVRRELVFLEKALAPLQIPVILLKGASYVLQGLPAASGRTFSDIDILVPRAEVGRAEAALMLGGWSTGKLSAYDHRYYREWSHEIPPMTHMQRGTTVDLHHSLAMPTCRIRVDSARMVADAVPLADGGFWWRLRDEDMVLHAASHLLLNSEFDRGLRDLWDIDLLVRHFSSTTPEFPQRVMARACAVGLQRILERALWLARARFATPFPAPLLPSAADGVTRLLSVAASTRHPDTRPATQSLADFVLLWREVFLRLPMRLLTAHLVHKVLAPLETQKKQAV